MFASNDMDFYSSSFYVGMIPTASPPLYTPLPQLIDTRLDLHISANWSITCSLTTMHCISVSTFSFSRFSCSNTPTRVSNQIWKYWCCACIHFSFFASKLSDLPFLLWESLFCRLKVYHQLGEGEIWSGCVILDKNSWRPGKRRREGKGKKKKRKKKEEKT